MSNINYDLIGDGNGGDLDPKTATQRDLLIVLHVKVDRLIHDVQDHESRIRMNERFRLAVPGVAAVSGLALALQAFHIFH